MLTITDFCRAEIVLINEVFTVGWRSQDRINLISVDNKKTKVNNFSYMCMFEVIIGHKRDEKKVVHLQNLISLIEPRLV